MPKPAAAWASLALCILAAGLESLRLGKDGNWDLQNYHFYNAYAFVNSRLLLDVAPAMLQSFHNPLADLPFYAMVRSGLGPRTIELVMAVPAGIGAFFLLALCAALFSRESRGRRICIAAAFIVGITGAAGRGVIGSTMNEWPCAALVMAAVYLVARPLTEGGDVTRKRLAAAGFMAGAAMGLKLTYGSYGLALCIAGASFGSWPARAKRFQYLCAFGAAGLAATYGFWGATLQREFANPFFPYFNGIFQSPWWEPISIHDARYGPKGFVDALAYPFLFAWNGRIADDANFHDLRLAAVLTLASLCAVVPAWRARAAAVLAQPAWRFVAVFMAAAYAAWLAAFGIYRYAIPLELVSGPVLVVLTRALFEPARAQRRAVVIASIVLVATTMKPNWGRLDPGQEYFETSVPPLPAGSLVILEPQRPLAHLAPFFPADARFVAPLSNLLAPGQENLLARRAREVLLGHRGPFFAIDHPDAKAIDELGASYGLRRDEATCVPFEARLAREKLRLCALRRAAS